MSGTKSQETLIAQVPLGQTTKGDIAVASGAGTLVVLSTGGAGNDGKVLVVSDAASTGWALGTAIVFSEGTLTAAGGVDNLSTIHYGAIQAFVDASNTGAFSPGSAVWTIATAAARPAAEKRVAGVLTTPTGYDEAVTLRIEPGGDVVYYGPAVGASHTLQLNAYYAL